MLDKEICKHLLETCWQLGLVQLMKYIKYILKFFVLPLAMTSVLNYI